MSEFRQLTQYPERARMLLRYYKSQSNLLKAMNAIQEVDTLIGMVRELLKSPVHPRHTTPQYREFHDKLTPFIYRNHLDETEEWRIIKANLIYSINDYMVAGEADRILIQLEKIKQLLLTRKHEPFWKYIHPEICKVTKDRFAGELYADSIEAAFKEINSRIKKLVKKHRNVEHDGADLMRTCFSEKNPILKISEMETENGRNVQKGYMEIFAGAMTGIRNPKAHSNLTITKEDAIRELNFASMLMYKVDQAVRNSGMHE